MLEDVVHAKSLLQMQAGVYYMLLIISFSFIFASYINRNGTHFFVSIVGKGDKDSSLSII
jgi:hypothetical protein